MKIIITLNLLLISVHIGNSLLIGAFNIKTFGDSKASNATLLDIITKVSDTHRIPISCFLFGNLSVVFVR